MLGHGAVVFRTAPEPGSPRQALLYYSFSVLGLSGEVGTGVCSTGCIEVLLGTSHRAVSWFSVVRR